MMPDANSPLAQFDSALGLPTADQQLLKDAAAAIRQEYRDGSQWKQLRCRKVSIYSETDRGTVCALHVGSSVKFDWTWEGARAFRPQSLDNPALLSVHDRETDTLKDELVWQGEVLEVDERNGCLFISLDDPEAIPTTGSFYVRPFVFLSVLDAVFHGPAYELLRKDMANRLAAAAGGIHPPVAHPTRAGLPQMQDWWQHSWNVLWGPPGTGKTWTTGRQIAEVLADPKERILVVSTTNRATDAVALSTGDAVRDRAGAELTAGKLLRIGKGASLQSFVKRGLESMLSGTESETLHQIDTLAHQLALFDSGEEKALVRQQIGHLQAGMRDASKRAFVDPNVRVVIATAFRATLFLSDPCVRGMLEHGKAPFTTLFIDEAGLVSRPAVAALSYLAAHRVVLAGDSKQLAPISRISRILPTRQKTWLASSGLSHLDSLHPTPKAVYVLSEQYRMHPEVCHVVSNYQYDGFLKTAPKILTRTSSLPKLFANYSRAIWYVLDEETPDVASIRAERGPGNKSWLRPLTLRILEKLLADPAVKDSQGRFISPFRTQAQFITQLFARWRLPNWQASTVHSQQGSEADLVIFDTVNAGSYGWPYEEWKRLVNVALSRAREAVVVLASRSEMEEPYLKPLVRLLTPSVLVTEGRHVRWEAVAGANHHAGRIQAASPRRKPSQGGMGQQIAQRQAMNPVLSKEQQRLINLHLDGKPRLVRGVAGSGKSMVLCNWLAKTAKRLEGHREQRIWAIYANRSLHDLLRQSIEAAWQHLCKDELLTPPGFPWDQVSLLHVKDVLSAILPTASLAMEEFDFNYDRAAEEFLNRQDLAQLLPKCKALFIDEAQDMGPSTLKLLLNLVEQTQADDNNSRSVHIFYDQAQNIYGRKIPTWSDLGIDMRGRSVILRESFRGTRPIAELAVNVFQRLTTPRHRQDQAELVELGLLEKTKRRGEPWLRVLFNEIDGPQPIYHTFETRQHEFDALAGHLKHLIQKEQISPSDICLIYNGKSVVQLIESKLKPKLAEMGVELSVQTNRTFQRHANTLVATTSHSYKGYESEVIMIPCVDQFVTGDGQVLAENLYVAMTRARSLLAIYGIRDTSPAARTMCVTIANCIETMNTVPHVESPGGIQDDLEDLLESLGHEHRKWLVDLWKQYEIRQEPIRDEVGKIVAQPLFWFDSEGSIYACFGNAATEEQLGEAGAYHVLRVGQSPG